MISSLKIWRVNDSQCKCHKRINHNLSNPFIKYFFTKNQYTVSVTININLQSLRQCFQIEMDSHIKYQCRFAPFLKEKKYKYINIKASLIQHVLKTFYRKKSVLDLIALLNIEVRQKLKYTCK